MSVMQTGQPGPMITFEARREARAQPELRDRLLVAAADVHHRHRCAADVASTVRAQRADQLARARRIAELERRRSCHRSCRPPVRCAAISPRTSAAIRSSAVSLAQQLLVQRERVLDVLGGNAADGEADVVQHVVAGRDRLVDESSRTAARTPQKSTMRRQLVDFDDTCPEHQTHATPVSFGADVSDARATLRDDRLAERDAAVARRHVRGAGARRIRRERRANRLGEPRVLEAAAADATTGSAPDAARRGATTRRGRRGERVVERAPRSLRDARAAATVVDDGRATAGRRSISTAAPAGRSSNG